MRCLLRDLGTQQTVSLRIPKQSCKIVETLPCEMPNACVISSVRSGRVVRWCWVNFQCQGVLLIWIIVGLGPTALVVGAGGGCLDIFSLIYHVSFLSPYLWESARYRLKYCLKEPLNPKQPTNQLFRPSELAYQSIPGRPDLASCAKDVLPRLNSST